MTTSPAGSTDASLAGVEHHPKLWLALFSVATLLAALGVVISIARIRFERRVNRELRALLAVAPAAPSASAPAALPAPVERYRQLAVGSHAPVQTVRLRHGGTFRMSATGKALPIRGMQLFTADPPGFVWTGHVRMFPGVWVDARDLSIDGKGSMRVLVDDVVPVADVQGAQIDQGSALRLLAEMVWYPTALFDERYVTWTAIDADHARATLRMHDASVSGVFEFGPDGMPVSITAQRFMDREGLRPWGGRYRDWRTVCGLRVPFDAEVAWELDAGRFTYAHWQVESLAFDEALRPATAHLERPPSVGAPCRRGI